MPALVVRPNSNTNQYKQSAILINDTIIDLYDVVHSTYYDMYYHNSDNDTTVEIHFHFAPDCEVGIESLESKIEQRSLCVIMAPRFRGGRFRRLFNASMRSNASLLNDFGRQSKTMARRPSPSLELRECKMH